MGNFEFQNYTKVAYAGRCRAGDVAGEKGRGILDLSFLDFVVIRDLSVQDIIIIAIALYVVVQLPDFRQATCMMNLAR